MQKIADTSADEIPEPSDFDSFREWLAFRLEHAEKQLEYAKGEPWNENNAFQRLCVLHFVMLAYDEFNQHPEDTDSEGS